MRSPESSNVFTKAREKLHDPRITMPYNDNAGIFKKDPVRAARFNHRIKALHSLLNNPELFGFEVNLVPTTSISHANDVVDAAIEAGHGAVIPIGGDSTAGRVAHRIALAEETIANPKPKLIVVGGGTQNIWRGEVSHKRDIFKTAIDLLVNGEVVYTDMGVVQADKEEIPFSVNAGISTDAIVLDKWEAEGKRSRAQLFPIFLRERHNIKPLDISIKDDITGIDTVFHNVSAMPIVNAGKYGGIFSITKSNMTDGELDCIVMPSELKEWHNLPHLITTALIPGSIFRGADYLTLQDAFIRDTNGEEIIFQCDGDPHKAGASDIRVKTLRGSVPSLVSNIDSPTFMRAA